MSDRPFLLNQWYVCARPTEVKHELLSRIICSVPIVFFRREDGLISALDNRCPHRMYPLSHGRLLADEIECGYHGIRFAADGRCLVIPAQEDIPIGFRARTFPVVEKSALVYIWMGDPAKADTSLIPEFLENVDAEWATTHDHLLIDANWQLIIDNLLDLGHLTFVHKTRRSSSGLPSVPLIVGEEEDRIRVCRELYDVEPPPIFETIRHFEGNIDRFRHFTFILPNHVHIRHEARAAGDSNDPDLVHH